MHNKTKKTVKNVVSTANNVNSAAANTNAASAATNAANAAAAADEFNAAHSSAIAVNTVFNALQATNTNNANAATLMQQAQQLTTTAQNVAAQQAAAAAAKAAKAVKKQKQTAAYILFLHNLIAANAYTAKQIVAMCAQQFTNVKLSTISTTVTDAKNAKYTRFNAVAVCNAQTKILSFASSTAAATSTAAVTTTASNVN